MDDIQEIKRKLSLHFEMKNLEDITTFLGLEIERSPDVNVITISQRTYLIAALGKFSVKTPLEPKLKLDLISKKDSNFVKPYR